MKPKIYLYCIPIFGNVLGYALAEDGTFLASHVSSNASWSKHDLGMPSDWHHEAYQKHYPDGFDLEWIDEPKSHVDFNKAFELHRAQSASEVIA